MECVKETVTQVNKTFSAEGAEKAFRQPLGKKTKAAGMLLEEVLRLQTKMKDL